MNIQSEISTLIINAQTNGVNSLSKTFYDGDYKISVTIENLLDVKNSIFKVDQIVSFFNPITGIRRHGTVMGFNKYEGNVEGIYVLFQEENKQKYFAIDDALNCLSVMQVIQ